MSDQVCNCKWGSKEPCPKHLDPATCPHVNVVPQVLDQTLGVACNDCNCVLGGCWGDEHVSEKLWNRACKNDTEMGSKPCEQDREDYCFLCEEKIGPKASDDSGVIPG